MTKEILETDVEFARQLLEEDRLESDIIRALGLRGIEAANSANLLADLRIGRKIRSKMILLPRRAAQKKPQK